MSLTVPGKVQAYLAARKPIIASMDGEGARIVVESGAGISCPAEDANALADVVRELRNKSSSELIKMGELAGEYYEKNYEPRMLAVKLGNILSKLSGK
jgi:glycosyltransferase involved in cell wall biosynthesis